MKVEVAVLAPVPNKPTVSVDVKQHFNNKTSVALPWHACKYKVYINITGCTSGGVYVPCIYTHAR